MELPLRKDILSGWIQRHPLVNIRFIAWVPTAKGEIPWAVWTNPIPTIPAGKKHWYDLPREPIPSGITPGMPLAPHLTDYRPPQPSGAGSTGGLPPIPEGQIPSGLFGGQFDIAPFLRRAYQAGGLSDAGAFGLSATKVGMSGEVERARLDILERMKRTTDSRAQSRLTLPKLFGDGKTEKNILADVL